MILGGLIRHSSDDSTFQFSAQDQIDIGNYMGKINGTSVWSLG